MLYLLVFLSGSPMRSAFAGLLLLLPLLFAAPSFAGHLRASGSESGAEGAAAALPEEEMPSAGGESGSDAAKEMLAKMLLSMADKLEGKSGGGGGAGAAAAATGEGEGAEAAAASSASFEAAIMQAVNILAKHQQTKLTQDQVKLALQHGKAASEEGKVGKISVGKIVAALRLAPLKPKVPFVDKKKLLAKAVALVEAKLDQLSDMLALSTDHATPKKPEEPEEPEEVAAKEMMPAPITFRLNMERPILP